MNPEDFLDIDFQVAWRHRLRFTDDVFAGDEACLAEVLEPSGDRPPRVQFWLDEEVARSSPTLVERIRTFTDAHADRLTRIGNVQLVPGGEAIKNDIHILERMLKVFHASDLDRRSYVVVVGGGAVLDAVGFAASIAHRGIRLVRIPTTTLAQADSGVGVKTGVNLFGKKNWIGTFAVPWAVINDTALLATLSDRDFICGFAEVLKVSLLKDAEMFAQLCDLATRIRGRDMTAAGPLIRRSAQWHLHHITRGGDPFEALEARPLDFGHWSAHKLEAISNFKIRHGEAVAIGLAIDVVYSSLATGLSSRAADRILKCLQDLGLSLSCPELLSDRPGLFAGMEEFRQHLGGRLTLTMLEDVGRPIDVHDVDRELMGEALSRVATIAKPEIRS
ncbi:MAG: 3-dehydroquinate synthase [Planctomycetota bacterium]|nr:MAG: 3-dehydroquinate synthase [Planctomycetota bacterium]REJ89945.1 MAG: 3-dehydroquinate synthase [Planctomycetota bacterium]REK28177.1 MAG: 3-dehydroquinate synthase [Planctomycetota bacterium]REK42435.1 MAG: 3-dehydroquinate synthase [Planctomycetota bacterium]